MDKFWEIAGKYNKTHQPDVDAAWRKFEDRIKLEEQGRVVPMWRRPVSWAAVALVVIAFAFLLQNNLVQEEASTFATAESETLQIELPDGSSVELNENSTLSYEAGFGESNRKIFFKGEAFFNVTRNEAIPFIVASNNLNVEVLGTSFNVRDYDAEGQAEVEVRSGLVKVAPPAQDQGVTLSKGDLAFYNFSQNTLQKLDGQGYNAGGWVDKDLIFTDAPVAEIFSDIERLYHIELITENTPILECSFDTEFKGENLENIFEIFSIAFNCEFKRINADSFEVVGGRCK